MMLGARSLHMNKLVLISVALIVAASGCTTFEQNEKSVESNDSEENLTRTQDYAGASGDYESASAKIDYTSNTEVAAEPSTPGRSSTLAAIARVTANHRGDRFQDLKLEAEFPGFADVTQQDVRKLVIDRGVNSTVESPGPEDISIQTYRVSTSEDSNTLTVSAGTPPDYELTPDDRIMLEFTSFGNPVEEGDRTVQLEVNSGTTDQLYEPVSATLEIES